MNIPTNQPVPAYATWYGYAVDDEKNAVKEEEKDVIELSEASTLNEVSDAVDKIFGKLRKQ